MASSAARDSAGSSAAARARPATALRPASGCLTAAWVAWSAATWCVRAGA